MALPPAVQSQVDYFNIQINTMTRERDRLVQLLDQNLPGNISVWNLVAGAAQTTIKSDIQQTMTQAQTNLTTVITAIGNL